MTVVILILKHATTLQLSNISEKALTLAELDYKEANIGSRIQEYLKAFNSGNSVENFADFIIATNIGLFICIYLQQYLIYTSSQNKEKIVEAIFRANSCEV